jgi:hypothetical protein
MSKNQVITLAQKLIWMKVVLENIQQVELKNVLVKYGYDDPRLNEGQVSYDNVMVLVEKQKAAIAEKLQAQRDFDVAMDEAFKHYTESVKISRRALLKDNGSIRDLGINSAQPRVFDEWLKTARSFYTTALSNQKIMNSMALFGTSQEKMQNGLNLLTALEPLFAIKTNMAGLAQVATKAKNEGIKAMSIWYRDFITIARIAFHDDKEHLERFGVIVMAPGTHKKKETTDTTSTQTTTTHQKADTEFNLDNPAAE